MSSLAWLIVWLPLLGFLFNAFLGKRAGKMAVAWVSCLAVLLSLAVTLLIWPAVYTAPEHRLILPLLPWGSIDTPWIKFGGFQSNFALLIDPLSLLMALIVTGVGGLIHIYATGYMGDDPEQPRFFTYFNLFIFMMLLLVLGENFLLMFVGWEGVGTCSYLLISFWYVDNENAKAGNKAFIVNRVGDLGFALGMMAVWSVFGTLSFFTHDGRGVMDLAAKHIAANGMPLSLAPSFFGMPAVTAICILLFIGATGKSAQIPLWVWLPDAMAGPTPVSALIHAATMVTAGVVMVTRCSWLFVQSTTALEVVAWIGVLTAFLGATIGLVQNDIKRVLAFSTISQLGYMFLACGVGNFTAGMFHVTTHAFFKALLFLGAGAVIHSLLGEQDMRKMGGLRYKIPKTWLVMITGTYAIAGIPPLSGFWSKDEILHSAANAPWGGGSSVGLVLWLIGVVTAFMTAFYMNRLMWKTFYTEPRYNEDELVAHPHHNFADEHEGHDTMVGHEEETTGQAAHHDQLEHGATRIHESPPSMMIPLFILAILSVVAGGLLGPTGYFERFLEPSVAPLSLGGLEEGHGPITPVIGYVVSTLIAIAGVALAAMLYRQHMKTGNLIPEERKVQLERNPLSPYTFLLNKWWWDWLYNTIFITIGGWLATNILWKVIDVGIVDGLFVKGLAGGTAYISGLTRRLQTGYVRNYALGMLVGVVALVIGLLVAWNNLPH
ncbi:MAG TPA: NADH-quinone oxidoreductase subunit L [Chthonomonadaceae bacterium]|nr:NADH-quinone oxidoreductase subunit L [Chthonomonadaceae bacterium]